MAKKPSLEEVYEKFRNKGYTPLFSQYENYKKPLPYVCTCGRKDEISWEDFFSVKDNRCWYCSHHIKGSEKEKKREINIPFTTKRFKIFRKF